MTKQPGILTRFWRQGRFFLVFIILLSIAITTVLVKQTTTPKAHAANVTSTAGLHVVGNQLQNSDNQTVRLVGVKLVGSESMCTSAGETDVFGFPTGDGSVAAIAGWNTNVVRLPLNEDCWLGINGEPAAQYSAAQYQQAIIDYVHLLNMFNLAVILDLEMSAPGSLQSTRSTFMPDWDHAPNFWDSVANTFKNNPQVIFDLFEEPFTASWDCWLNGNFAPGDAPCANIVYYTDDGAQYPYAVVGMQALVDTVRATGAHNMIIASGPNVANDLSQWLQYQPYDPYQQLIASMHIYDFSPCANSGCWDAQEAPVAAQVPVVIGELGETDCTSNFITPAMNYFDQQGTSYIGAFWATYNCNLISNYDGTPTAFGQGFHDHLISLYGSPGGYLCDADQDLAGGEGQTLYEEALTFENLGQWPVGYWAAAFDLPAGQQITDIYGAAFAQNGTHVTIYSLPGLVAAHTSVNVAYYATFDTPTTTGAGNILGVRCGAGSF